MEGLSDNGTDGWAPWGALANQNSSIVIMGRFWAGDILPELHQKWAKAFAYVVFSALGLVFCFGLTEFFAPEILKLRDN